MKCIQCKSDYGEFKCKCGANFCIDCGLKQGKYTNDKFEKCRKCVKKCTTIEGLPPPKGWEEFWKDNAAIIKTISKKVAESAKTTTVYPPLEDIFTAFKYCQPQDIKAVIVGQDCYHGKGQAHGLSFSVRPGVTVPPSLVNIYKELESDGFTIKNKKCGDLSHWAKQGVFMINTALTVEESKAGSHLKLWKPFTDQVIKYINYNCQGLVFILWGAHAKNCGKIVNGSHRKVEAAHPSPVNTAGGFFGSCPFSQTNEHLEDIGKEPIDWNL